jgi:colanic acid biosynthesis glycosyl transferase WcaI
MNNIYFVNQSAGSLFINLAKDISNVLGKATLLYGEKSSRNLTIDDNLAFINLPSYNRRGVASRIMSGLLFAKKSFQILVRMKPEVLLAVSNPPFISIVMYVLSKVISTRYILLVYDIYPDVLIGTGVFNKNNILVKIWRSVNKIVYENSAGVITIGESMESVLDNQFDSTKTEVGKIQVIHNCADKNVFQPPRNRNHQKKKETEESGLKIVYSGNFGFTHDFDTILDVAKLIKNTKHRFYLVGEGAKKKPVELRIKSEKITNVISRTYFKESEFPDFISSADVALITMSSGCEDLMVPSKIYISMAVGSALIGITNEKSEVARLIRKHKCGAVVPEGDSDTLLNVIKKFSNDKKYLEECKNNSFKAFNQNYTRELTSQKYLEVFNKVIHGS